MKKVLSFVLALAMVLSMSACGQSGSGSASSQASSGKKLPTIDSLKLGEDYKDIKADLKFLTHRTDIVNTKLAQYVKDFQKLYPNINVKYEAITNYSDDVTTRMTTNDWGDICMIPNSVQNSELGDHFQPMGSV
ncbi:MAG: carbohydrate ABC transporter substrate-binding protein, partial [Clostridiales bacterium]|nr:carbohydrate ABC transporter substrate-binding protein [Clostridiales bacterium]